LPDSQVNWISTLAIDVPYNLSYVFWFIGAYLLRLLLREHSAFELDLKLNPLPNTHFLIFTKKDGAIIEVSHNFYSFFTMEDVKEKTLEAVLDLGEREYINIKETLRVRKKIGDQLIRVKNPSGAFQEAWLCGVAVFSPQGEYSGANYMIRTRVETDQMLDNRLSDSEKSVVRHFLTHGISNEEAEIRQLLTGYYLAQIKALYNIVFHEGGATMSQLLLDELHSTAQHYGWQIQLNPQTILNGEEYSLEVLRNALPIFLETAKRFASRITGSAQVEAQLKELHGQIGETIQKSIARYGKPE
jgi:hypothetical protein